MLPCAYEPSYTCRLYVNNMSVTNDDGRSVMNEGSGMPDLLPLLGQDGESIHDWLKGA